MNRRTPGLGIAVALATAAALAAKAPPVDAPAPSTEPEPERESRAGRRVRERLEMELIGKIATRARAFTQTNKAWIAARDRSTIVIVLIQVLRAYPHLNLEALLGFDDKDFLHDLTGIINNVKPVSGDLGDFLPKALKERA